MMVQFWEFILYIIVFSSALVAYYEYQLGVLEDKIKKYEEDGDKYITVINKIIKDSVS